MSKNRTALCELELSMGYLVWARFAFGQPGFFGANRSAFCAHEHCPHTRSYEFDLCGELEIVAVRAAPGQAPSHIARRVNWQPAQFRVEAWSISIGPSIHFRPR